VKAQVIIGVALLSVAAIRTRLSRK